MWGFGKYVAPIDLGVRTTMVSWCILRIIFTQGAKCAHHENGHGGKEGVEEEKEKLGDKFRHHPIYKLALGQVGRNVTRNVTTILIVVWSGSDCGLGPVGHHHLLQRRPPRSLHPQ